MTLKELINTVFFVEILKGLALTFKAGLSKPVTRQYPEEPHESMAGFRGLHALVRESSTGREKCIACGLCGAICPAQCIKIVTGEDEDNRKVAERYEIDTARCIFCALCVEACPVGAITLTGHYAYSAYTREDLYFTKDRLLENWDKYMAGDKGRDYLKRFWLPNSDCFREYEGQAVFKGTKKAKEETKDAA